MQNSHQQIKHLPEFEKAIGYVFKDKKHILTALTHSSYANENRGERPEYNERLEFLGDAVLNISISEKIFKQHTTMPEGELTKLRASIVCESSLEKCATRIQIGEYLLLGKGEELSGGRNRTSILSDAFEALIGAIYLDSGLEAAKVFIYSQMDSIIEGSVRGNAFTDYKTQLQERIQKGNESRVTYEIIEEKGPDHNKTFVIRVLINERVAGTGEGRSKKEAEQSAAQQALESISHE